jgi:peptidoglycan/xylan/chitin deacetylase (PgdA/CDA1 family)
MITATTDTDSHDWQRPGVEQIVRQATPPDGQDATVLLHDAGGDRSQTVAALDRLIPALQARGYAFTTVSDGLRRAIADDPAGAATAAVRTGAPATAVQR